MLADVKELLYSAVLDGHTCETCARLDGRVFSADYEEDAPGAICAPNHERIGGRGCQSVWVAVLKDEAPSKVRRRSAPNGCA